MGTHTGNTRFYTHRFGGYTSMDYTVLCSCLFSTRYCMLDDEVWLKSSGSALIIVIGCFSKLQPMHDPVAISHAFRWQASVVKLRWIRCVSLGCPHLVGVGAGYCLGMETPVNDGWMFGKGSGKEMTKSRWIVDSWMLTAFLSNILPGKLGRFPGRFQGEYRDTNSNWSGHELFQFCPKFAYLTSKS